MTNSILWFFFITVLCFLWLSSYYPQYNIPYAHINIITASLDYMLIRAHSFDQSTHKKNIANNYMRKPKRINKTDTEYGTKYDEVKERKEKEFKRGTVRVLRFHANLLRPFDMSSWNLAMTIFHSPSNTFPSITHETEKHSRGSLTIIFQRIEFQSSLSLKYVDVCLFTTE